MSAGILKADELEEIKDILADEQAAMMIERDVYWPKWDSPYWFFFLLEETDRLEDIPIDIFKEMLMCADRQFLNYFPTCQEEVPEGLNPDVEIMCFCMLGSLMRLCSKLDFDVFAWLPWAKDWISRYQLPDGGYNCDANAYIESGKSSIVSTVVLLEGMLAYGKHIGSYEEFSKNVEKAVSYLLKHHIYMSSNAEEIKEMEWDKIIFPRFYEFDFSRGLEVVLDFVLQTGKKVRKANTLKAIDLFKKKYEQGVNGSEKKWLNGEKTVSYYSDTPVLFEDRANIPVVMKKYNGPDENPYVKKQMERIKQKLEKADQQLV
ncbi:MAG: hypothetical protein ACQETH_09160 [Candidatus Rifleibacteriota bacterium]